MRYEEELIEEVGTFSCIGSEDWGVVVCQPHCDPERATIALDTPDGRRHDLEPDQALTLARLLAVSPARLADAHRAVTEDVE
jgi:hypothetical protein